MGIDGFSRSLRGGTRIVAWQAGRHWREEVDLGFLHLVGRALLAACVYGICYAFSWQKARIESKYIG